MPSHQSASLIRTANSPCSATGNITEVMILSLQLEFSHRCGGLEIQETKCTHSIWIKARLTWVTELASSHSLQGRSRLSPKPASDRWATGKMPVQIMRVIIAGRVNNGSRACSKHWHYFLIVTSLSLGMVECMRDSLSEGVQFEVCHPSHTKYVRFSDSVRWRTKPLLAMTMKYLCNLHIATSLILFAMCLQSRHCAKHKNSHQK